MARRDPYTILAATAALIMLLPSLAPIAVVGQAPGPASDQLVFRQVPTDQVYQEFANGTLDLYVGWLNAASRLGLIENLTRLGSVEYIKTYGGIIDLLLNPAPVLMKTYNGTLTRDEVAALEGVPPAAVTYLEVDAANNQTYAEFGAHPEAGINPFAFRRVRFAFNYLVDREWVVETLLKGWGAPIYELPYIEDPQYYDMMPTVVRHYYTPSLALADAMITQALEAVGAVKAGGKWYYYGEPINITFVIRVEDIRYDIGNRVADELEALGFTVTRKHLTFTNAIYTVYYSDPASFQWHIYTEGWGKGPFDRWDPITLIQFGAPWFGWMPGLGMPGYWNYKNQTIDQIAQQLFFNQYTSKDEYIQLYTQLANLVAQEALRIWIALTATLYPYNAAFQDAIDEHQMYYNYRSLSHPNKTTLTIGTRWVWYLYDPWNPYGGFQYPYSTAMMRATYDYPVWTDPFNGETRPFRANYTVETAGPTGTLQVPADAVYWDAVNDQWVPVGSGVTATSKVTFDMSKYIGAKWHHGANITWADILATWATMYELAHDPQKTSLEPIDWKYAPFLNTVKGIRILPDQGLLEVYVDYWHFDPNYIARYAAGFNPMNPAELQYIQFYLAFTEKTYALSRERARNEGIPQLSLVLPSHAADVARVAGLLANNTTLYPASWFTVGNQSYMTLDEWLQRLQALTAWINATSNAWVSLGPYMLISFDPEGQTATLLAFRDPSYPYTTDTWRTLAAATPKPPRILGIDAPPITVGANATITVRVEGTQPIRVGYALRYPPTGEVLTHGLASSLGNGTYTITLPANTTSLLDPAKIYELLVVAKSSEHYASALDTRPIYVEPDAHNETAAEANTTVALEANTTTADVVVEANTTAPAEVAVAVYEDLNLTEVAAENSEPLGYAVDLYTNDTEALQWPVYVEVRYNETALPPGTNESQLAIYYYNVTLNKWVKCSNTGVDTVNNVVWAYVTREEYEAGIGNLFTVHVELPARNLTITSIDPGPTHTVAQAPGTSTLSFTVALTNYGEIDEQVNATANLLWTVGNATAASITVTPATATIPVNATATFTVNVTVNTTGIGRLFIVFNATSSDGTVYADQPITVDVARVEITPKAQAQTILDNETATYTFTITSHAVSAKTYHISVDHGNLSATTITIPAGGSRTVELRVSGSPDTTVTSTITVTAADGPTVNATATATTRILVRYRFEASLETPSTTGKANATVQVQVRITNLGALADTYTLTAPNAQTPVNITIPNGTTATATISLLYTRPGTYTEPITVTSQGSGSATTLTVQVTVALNMYTTAGTGTLTVSAPEANTTVEANATGPVEITVLVLTREMVPQPPHPHAMVGLPVDILVNDTAALTYPVTITIRYSDQQLEALGLAEDQLTPMRYDEAQGAWVPFTNYQVDTETNTVTIQAQQHELQGVVVSLMAPPARVVGGALLPASHGAPTTLILILAAAALTLLAGAAATRKKRNN